ncbi:hypothetical protein [Niveispirillum sp. KHB5.9]|uniref:hypothetical protein n=1 Tax=Niveispirillum sp. KHB5.9 TaxID=3400269 RepID=UPI003A853B29
MARLAAILVVLCLTGAGAAHAASQPPPVWQCVDANRIGSWSFIDHDSILIAIGPGDYYRVRLDGLLPEEDLRLQGAVSFVPRTDRQLCAAVGHVVVGGRWFAIRSITVWRGRGGEP